MPRTRIVYRPTSGAGMTTRSTLLHAIRLAAGLPRRAVAVVDCARRRGHDQVEVVHQVGIVAGCAGIIRPGQGDRQRRGRIGHRGRPTPALAGVEAGAIIVPLDMDRRRWRQNALQIQMAPALGEVVEGVGCGGSMAVGTILCAVQHRRLDQRGTGVGSPLHGPQVLAHDRGRARGQRCGHAGAAVEHVLAGSLRPGSPARVGRRQAAPANAPTGCWCRARPDRA